MIDLYLLMWLEELLCNIKVGIHRKFRVKLRPFLSSLLPFCILCTNICISKRYPTHFYNLPSIYPYDAPTWRDEDIHTLIVPTVVLVIILRQESYILFYISFTIICLNPLIKIPQIHSPNPQIKSPSHSIGKMQYFNASTSIENKYWVYFSFLHW